MKIQESLKLPRVFIFLAFLNFVVGSTLGGLMASNMTWWPALSSVHAELNPFGWLTMLIYGMTYVVLFLSLGMRLPKSWQGGVHVAFAEGGVILMIVGLVWQMTTVYRIGLLLQTLTPFLFLINIMSMVIARKRQRLEQRHDGVTQETLGFPQASLSEKSASMAKETAEVPAKVENLQYEVSETADIIELFGVVDALKSTDRVAQRGTDVSLIILMISGIWIAISQFAHTLSWPFSAPQTPMLLVYYGWIGGTVLSVAMHLYPRLMGIKSIAGWYAQLGQVFWGVAIVLLFTSGFWNFGLIAGGRVMGLAIGWQAVGYLATLRLPLTLQQAKTNLQRLHIGLWAVAWAFALVLGMVLLSGADLTALAVLHLLFLGWITTLVYSIGYRVFPLLLNRSAPPAPVIVTQVLAALVGAVLMPVSLWLLQQGNSHAMTLLSVGGTIATIGALIFLLQWMVKLAGSHNGPQR